MRLNVTCIALLMVCGPLAEANYQTKNFSVIAPTPEAAKAVAEAAESLRVELGKLWLGKPLPDWSFSCRIDVDTTSTTVGGFTEVSFTEGRIFSQKIVIKGPLERILKGPLAHELTHLLFAHAFGSRPPRWADEGGAILSEAGSQGAYQSKKIHAILAQQRQFKLREFLSMQEYPTDLACLYAQGHSVSQFLVDAKGHATFMAFVRTGMQHGWDKAAADKYGLETVEELERDWLNWVEARRASAGQTGTLQGATVQRTLRDPTRD